MRDLILLGLVAGMLPVIAFRPYFGLLVYAWLAFMRPQDLTWGMARSLPLSQWVAIAMAVGLLFTMGRERLATLKTQTVLMILLWGWISLSVLNALNPALCEHTYGLYWKAILISVLTTGLVHDRQRLRIAIIVIAFCLGLLGTKYGLFGLLRGGARFYAGPGGFMSDNNSFALALNMTLPLLIGIALVEKLKVLRLAAAGMAVFSLLTIVFTFSRGGFLTLAVIAPMLIWRSKHRTAVILVLAIGFSVLFYTSSGAFKQDYVDRASSISDYEEDGSARGRLNAWQTAWSAFLDYPVFGVGPNNFQVVFRTYSPTPDRFRVQHNAYLQILSESGLPALLLFLGAIGSTLWRLQRLRGDIRFGWAETYARMLQLSMLAYLVGSLFLNTAYSELVYSLIGLSVALEVVARKEAAADASEAVTASGKAMPGAGKAPADPALPWWKQPRPAAAPAPPRSPASAPASLGGI
ncbi:MAG TPA: putative O-glycosylation ligase, exosortase A system-associated [Thermoanaerobaculia bacterium]|nr:putative O-glycosylation ligase, exosortase A system-associated [Thermoanaerobaculia bacterium]